jgi:ribonucleoside-diphosphate reductase alpha chain
LAAERAPFICQSQSLNIFLPADVHKRDLHQIHFQAWAKGVKSLYYCRSMSIQRADKVSAKSGDIVVTLPLAGRINQGELPTGELTLAAAATAEAKSDYDECLACQ